MKRSVLISSGVVKSNRSWGFREHDSFLCVPSFFHVVLPRNEQRRRREDHIELFLYQREAIETSQDSRHSSERDESRRQSIGIFRVILILHPDLHTKGGAAKKEILHMKKALPPLRECPLGERKTISQTSTSSKRDKVFKKTLSTLVSQSSDRNLQGENERAQHPGVGGGTRTGAQTLQRSQYGCQTLGNAPGWQQ